MGCRAWSDLEKLKTKSEHILKVENKRSTTNLPTGRQAQSSHEEHNDLVTKLYLRCVLCVPLYF